MTQEFIDYLFKFFVVNKDNICNYCKNHKECSENCTKYESYGKNGTFIYCDGKEIPYESSYELSCMDVEFGKCPLLENTKCNGCFENNVSGFEWNNVIPKDYNHY